MIVKLDHFQFSSFKKNQLLKKSSVPHGSVMVSWLFVGFLDSFFGRFLGSLLFYKAS